MPIAEIYGGISAFKTMLDMAKALKDMNDATARNAAVIELQEKILTAQQAQSDLIDRVRALEAEIAHFEAWEGEKERYELKPIGYNAVAFMLKPAMRGSETPHWLCPNCFERRQRSYLQPANHYGGFWVCKPCGTAVDLQGTQPKWL